MPLIVEDGTALDSAQSAVSVAEVRAWADARGIVVPSIGEPGDLTIQRALITSMDYLQSPEFCYRGRPVSETQGIPFPRKYFYYDDETLLADNVVPANFKTAQIRLSIAVMSGVDLMPTLSNSNTDYIVKEKVGPIEIEYASPTNYNGITQITAVDALLATLTGGDCCPDVGFLKVRRV